jgi:hypothetical protein
MRLFTCPKCEDPLHFEDYECAACETMVGFQTTTLTMERVGTEGRRLCSNAEHRACNWLVEEGSANEFCMACDLNNIIPDLEFPGNLELWRHVEVAKHRLLYSLLRLGLPIYGKEVDRETGLQFDFVRDGGVDDRENPVNTTGHTNGVITLNVAEADDAAREERRMAMGEPYRTLLGHFRHEIAHYYWQILLEDSPRHEAYRECFGDERANYGESLKRHYEKGAPKDWADEFISEYASAHPWEDWAETTAHYLHIMDTLETAQAFGLRVKPKGADAEMTTNVNFDPYEQKSFDKIMSAWYPLTFALNSLNRSMGFRDLYPFVLKEPVIRKLEFLHSSCINRARRSGVKPEEPAAEKK